VTGKRTWTLPERTRCRNAEQITRHICVEGWSAIGRWGGTPFGDFLRRVGADTSAKYVGFKCADDYYESIDMPTALHPQTLLTFEYDGERCPRNTATDEAADADQARLQEIRSTSSRCSSPTRSLAAIGSIRATTGSEAPDARGSRSARRMTEGRRARA